MFQTGAFFGCSLACRVSKGTWSANPKEGGELCEELEDLCYNVSDYDVLRAAMKALLFVRNEIYEVEEKSKLVQKFFLRLTKSKTMGDGPKFAMLKELLETSPEPVLLCKNEFTKILQSAFSMVLAPYPKGTKKKSQTHSKRKLKPWNYLQRKSFDA